MTVSDKDGVGLLMVFRDLCRFRRSNAVHRSGLFAVESAIARYPKSPGCRENCLKNQADVMRASAFLCLVIVVQCDFEQVFPFDAEVAFDSLLPSNVVLVVDSRPERVSEFVGPICFHWEVRGVFAVEPTSNSFFNEVIYGMGLGRRESLAQVFEDVHSVRIRGASKHVMEIFDGDFAAGA